MVICMFSSKSTHPDLAAVESASGETAMILAACHSLVVVEEDEAPQDGDDKAFNLVGAIVKTIVVVVVVVVGGCLKTAYIHTLMCG